MKNQKLKWGVIAGIILSMVAGSITLLFRQRSVQVWYHRNRMNAAWRATSTGPKTVTSNGLVGVPLGASHKRYQAEREALVRLGEIREFEYKFKHLKRTTREGEHVIKTLLSLKTYGTPPDLFWESPTNPEGAGNLELHIWVHHSKTEKLLSWLNDRDIVGYEEQYLRPDIVRQAEDIVSGWVNLGIGLPSDTEIDLFRSEFDLTQDVLVRGLKNEAAGIRTAAAYVVENLKADAAGLAPVIVAGLRDETDSTTSIYLMNALIGIGDRSKDTVDAIRQRWIAPVTQDVGPVMVKLTAARSLWLLAEADENRNEPGEFILSWLKVVPAELDKNKRNDELQCQRHAVYCVRRMPGFVEAVPRLKKLLEATTEDWEKKWVSEAIEAASEQKNL